MNSRGMSGKWNDIWHSSPSPKYATASSGQAFASARNILLGKRSSTCLRSARRKTCVSGRCSHRVPSRSYRYGTASSRMPSTPSLNQKSTTGKMASHTAGLS